MPFLEEPRIMPGTRFMLKSVYIPKGEHKYTINVKEELL